MNTTNSQGFAHSADVRIALRVDGHVLPVSHLGPDFLVLKNTVDHDGIIAQTLFGNPLLELTV
jgi:hypothetical protein